MNSISWLIYLAEAVTGLSILLGVGAVVVLVFIGFWCLFRGIEHDIEVMTSLKQAKGLIFTCLAALFIMVLVPSQRTIYLIAASEIGESVLTNPESKKYLLDIKEIIDKKIAELKAE